MNPSLLTRGGDAALYETAANWLQRLRDTPEDDELLAEWLQWSAHRDHQDAFEKVSAVWQALPASNLKATTSRVRKSMRADASIPTEPGSARPHTRRSKRADCAQPISPLGERIDLARWVHGESGVSTRSPWSFRVATASAVALFIYLVGFTAWIALGRTDWISYTTSIGGYERVSLADGSVIQLNTDSELKARITTDKREIEVLRGEALIKAANDPLRPMTVSAANALAHTAPGQKGGTAFVVRMRSPENVDIAVTDGTLAVRSSYRIIDVAMMRHLSSDSVLAAGSVVMFRPEGIHFERIGLEEINRKLSWTVGLLSFQGETLAEITDEFNRYNRRQLIVTDPAIASRRIGGAFQATDPDSFVAALKCRLSVEADPIDATTDSQVVRLRSSNHAVDTPR